MEEKLTIEDMAAFCKKKGFVYPSGEIYGGLSGFWDYGPLGSELKKTLKIVGGNTTSKIEKILLELMVLL
jgi:glycyl-tRNA synthetase